MRVRLRLIGLVGATLTTLVANHAAPRAEQGGSALAPIVRTERAGAGIVRVVYDLDGAAGALFSVSLEASTDGGRTFAIRPSAVTGDVGAGVSPGTNKTIAWDTTKDVEELQLERFVFRIVVSGGGQPAASPAGAATPTPPAGGRGGASTPRSTPNAGNAGKKGGGLSKGALIAIVGGGAAAGVGVAAKSKGGSSASPPSTSRTFTAQISAPITFRFLTCVRDEMWTGTLSMRLDIAADGAVTGFGGANVSTSVVAVNSFCSPTSPQPGSTAMGTLQSSPVTGNTSRLVFSGRTIVPNTAAGAKTDDWSFSGTLAADVVTGTLDWSVSYAGTEGGGGGLGTTRFNVTAR
jgi:hypothetical protein